MDRSTDFSPFDGLKLCICILAGALLLGVTKLIVEWSHSALVVTFTAVGAVIGGAVRSMVALLSIPENQLRPSPDSITEAESLRAEIQQLRQQLAAIAGSVSSGAAPSRPRPAFSSSFNVSASPTLPNFSTPISSTLRNAPPGTGSGANSKVSRDAVDRIPLFDGGKPEDDAVTWIALVEDIGRAEGWTASAHRRAATSRLVGAAADWHLTDGLAFSGWEEWRYAFLEMFSREFTLEGWSRMVSARMRDPNETALAYSLVKRRMCSRCPVPLQDKEVIQRLVTGLNSEALSAAVTVANPTTLADYFAVIRRLDAAQSDHIWPSASSSNFSTRRVTFSVPPPSHSVPPPTLNEPKVARGDRTSCLACLACGLTGHSMQDCPRSRPGNEAAGPTGAARNAH
jgi:hypothetical protein